MNTTVVAQSAIGALAALIGGLGGAAIATRPQRSNEQRRQRERAAEALGLVGPLLTELEPRRMLVPIYLAEVLDFEPDPLGEALAKLAELDERVSVVRENLSTLAGWWASAKGADLAQQLEAAILDIHRVDRLLLEDIRSNRDHTDLRDRSYKVWDNAFSLANQLRAEIRGEAPRTPHKLLLPAHPESWQRLSGS
jgi:hypothetical protein